MPLGAVLGGTFIMCGVIGFRTKLFHDGIMPNINSDYSVIINNV